MSEPVRIPPQSVETEEAVIGAMLVESHVADEVLSRVTGDMFYKPVHQSIFEAVKRLYSEGKPVDLITVEAELERNEELEFVGKDYLSDLTRSVASSANVDYLCEIIREKHIRRELIQNCSEIIKQAYDTSTDTQDVMDSAQSAVFSITERDNGTLRTIHETIQDIINRVQSIQESGQPMGLRTGLDIDRTLNGFQDGKLYIIGARPSMGKTALVMTIMRRLSRDGHKTGIISLETSDDALGTRLISQACEISVDRINSGQMSVNELERFEKACYEIGSHGIFIDDQAAVSAQQIRAKCRLMVKRGVEIIFVDFLQLITAEGRSKHEEIGTITKVLKQVAKETSIPVVVLSQLSRKVEERHNKRPQMSDLRESGSIEEDADCIMFLYRAEYYGVTKDDNGNDTAGLAEVIIAKNKDGKTGLHMQRFIKEYMRFENNTNIPEPHWNDI